MIVTNRKLFKKRPARDRLNQAAGIMASSPELMGEVQGFQNGGNVQLPGTVGSIVQMLDAVTELPEIVVRGIKSKFSPKTPVNPIQEVPVTMPNGEPGFAIYENGKLKGYTTSPSSQPMIKDRSKQIKEITSEVRPPVNVSSTSLSNLLRGLVGADKGKSEAVQEFEEAKERGELGIQDSRLLEMLGGRGTYAEKGLTGILRLVPELQEFVGDLSGSALDLLRQPTEETKTKSVSQTLPGVNYRSEDFPEGIPKDTPVSVGATTEQIFDLISQGTGPKGDPETVEQILKQMEIDRITAESIQKGKEDTERMKGPVAPTTSLSSRVEKVKAEARKKEAEDLSRAIGSKIRPEDVETRKQYQEEKEIEELNRIVSENQKQAEKAMGRGSTSTNVEDQKDDKTFDAMGDLDNNQKEAIVNQTDKVVQTTTGSDLDDLMQAFISKAPDYEGVDKGMAIAKIGFAIAAGKSADGIQNIADGFSLGADILIKDKSEKDAFNRQVKLSALQYGLGELSKEKAQARADARTFTNFIANKDVTWNGTEYKAGTPIRLSYTDLMKGGIPKEFVDAEIYFENEAAVTEKAAAFNEALQENYENKLMTDEAFRKVREDYSSSVQVFIDSNVGGEFIQKAILILGDEDQTVTGAKGIAKALGKKLADFAGVKLNKGFSDKEEFRKMVKLGFQNFIRSHFRGAGGQSANSISNFDVTSLANAYVDAAIFDDKSVFSFGATNPDLLLSQLQETGNQFKIAQEKALSNLSSLESQIAGRYIPGGNVLSPRLATEPLTKFKERLDPYLTGQGGDFIPPVYRDKDGLLKFTME